ncbi:galectin-1-like, partial [Vombatus ursinus]|uniref:galectin-1-like n=1 Tax=Vombatus ursinus TaxID=29139 RepID=UPI000FFD812B
EAYLTALNIQHGVWIKLKGDILPDATVFRVNLGTDDLNIGLHFNPRFDYLGDVNIIVFNSRKDGKWGGEHRERNFPFVPGTTVEIQMMLEEQQFRVRMHDGSDCAFPNHLDLRKIDFISVYGDFSVRRVEFE